MKKNDLKKQIEEKERELIPLREKYVEAKKKGNQIEIASIETAGKRIKVDLDILVRRLRALNMSTEKRQVS